MFGRGLAMPALLSLAAAAGGALAAPHCARADTVQFTAPCTSTNWPVPTGVTSITVEAFGAQGGGGGPGIGPGGGVGAPGALGGSATVTLSVTPGEMLQVNVGGQGGSPIEFGAPGSAGCNGGALGGTGTPGGGGGGGASDVRKGGTALANRVVIAGGGGGGGGGGSVEFGGGGGGTGGGTSGGPGTNGAGAQFGGVAGLGGAGGTQAGPGTGAALGGSTGSLGIGGAGGAFMNGAGGGGAGGGFYGGGGGGAAFGFGAGGGGGGSGLVPGGGTPANGVRAGDGLVQITWQPSAATFTSMSAKRTARGVVVRWRTASEIDTLGFLVYRQVEGKRIRVTRTLIPAKSAASGSAYSYLDRRAPKGKALRYWIQQVAVDGSRSWYGPARVVGGR
jgi:hypothetical protein